MQHFSISLPPTPSAGGKVPPLCGKSEQWATIKCAPLAQVFPSSQRASRKCNLGASPLVSSMLLSFSLGGARWELYKRTTGTLWYSSFSLFLKVWS